MPPVRFALGLGANLPHDDSPPSTTLARAIAWLSARFGPLRVAPLYRTDPFSAVPQERYFNTAVAGSTRQPPEALLRAARELESEAGRPDPEARRRQPPDLPRALDVDVLLYGAHVSQRPELILPHPRLAERRFALAPLADILPDTLVPPSGATVAALLAALDERPRLSAAAAHRVERIDWPSEARALLP